MMEKSNNANIYARNAIVVLFVVLSFFIKQNDFIAKSADNEVHEFRLVYPYNNNIEESNSSVIFDVNTKFINPAFKLKYTTEVIPLVIFYPSMTSYSFKDNYRMIGCAGYCGGRKEIFIKNDFRNTSEDYWKKNPYLFGDAPPTDAEFYARKFLESISAVSSEHVKSIDNPGYGLDKLISVNYGSSYSDVWIKYIPGSSSAMLFVKCDRRDSVKSSNCTLHFSASRCKAVGIDVNGIEFSDIINVVDIFKHIDLFVSEMIKSGCNLK